MDEHDAKAEMRVALARWGEVDAEELQEVTTFRGYRHRRELRIEILDSGRPFDPHRWNGIVTDLEDGRQVFGNGAESIEVALSAVHWDELDVPGGDL